MYFSSSSSQLFIMTFLQINHLHLSLMSLSCRRCYAISFCLRLQCSSCSLFSCVPCLSRERRVIFLSLHVVSAVNLFLHFSCLWSKEDVMLHQWKYSIHMLLTYDDCTISCIMRRASSSWSSNHDPRHESGAVNLLFEKVRLRTERKFALSESCGYEVNRVCLFMKEI